MCSPKPPKPDPLIGQAAKQNADIAQQQLDVAREQLAWEKDRAQTQDPLIQKIVGQQIASQDANAARAESQWETYRKLFAPVEERMVQDANTFDSRERQDRMAAEAAADVARGYRGMLESNQRAMERMGINPNSGKFQSITKDLNLGLARDSAGAMNKARRDIELQGMAMRQGAAQFGRSMPTTGIATDAAALSAGNSATDNLATKAGLHNAGTNTAQNWFGGATGANTAAGNLALGQYQGQLNAWQQAAQNSATGAAGLGNLIGQLGSAYIMKPIALRKGGIINGGGAHESSHGTNIGHGEGGLSPLEGSAGSAGSLGGLIRGRGNATSDSIPGTIEGRQPIRLSNGEAVLNAKAVKLLGEDFIHWVNNIAFATKGHPAQDSRTMRKNNGPGSVSNIVGA
ncbi:hypothetical protein [Nitrosovibrio tenuis]|uniref:Uncharacterized protein n=1 Tax=Nitrosovibrio tenuis TaxID=1233 RepID=A0A1H7IRD2_9PROT|nr:hypothetical protein [Nitrosovibrio tenuis]SEK64844.1 hypothetical protein SAMN05216387_102269 [Nitrosovibrio tenuis]